MTKSESAKAPLEMPFDFLFRVTGSGWATVRIQLPDRRIDVTASGVFSDPAPDLLTATDRILSGERRVDFSWEEEPGEYRWVFDTEAERTRLRILELRGTRVGSYSSLTLNEDPALIPQVDYADPDHREYGVVMDITAPTRALALAIVGGVSREYQREGELGYWEEWGYRFPVAELWVARETLGLRQLERNEGTTLRTEKDLWQMEWSFREITEDVWRWDVVQRAHARALRDGGASSPLLHQARTEIRKLMSATGESGIDLPRARQKRDEWLSSRAAYEMDPLAWMGAEEERRVLAAKTREAEGLARRDSLG